MVIKSRENSVAAWAFLAGVILAVIAGIFTRGATNPSILILIGVSGLFVGYFIPEKDVQVFMLASISAVLASFAGIQGLATNVSLTGVTVSGIAISKFVLSVFGAMLFLFVPATIIAAIKTVFSIAKV